MNKKMIVTQISLEKYLRKTFNYFQIEIVTLNIISNLLDIHIRGFVKNLLTPHKVPHKKRFLESILDAAAEAFPVKNEDLINLKISGQSILTIIDNYSEHFTIPSAVNMVMWPHGQDMKNVHQRVVVLLRELILGNLTTLLKFSPADEDRDDIVHVVQKKLQSFNKFTVKSSETITTDEEEFSNFLNVRKFEKDIDVNFSNGNQAFTYRSEDITKGFKNAFYSPPPMPDDASSDDEVDLTIDPHMPSDAVESSREEDSKDGQRESSREDKLERQEHERKRQRNNRDDSKHADNRTNEVTPGNVEVEQEKNGKPEAQEKDKRETTTPGNAKKNKKHNKPLIKERRKVIKARLQGYLTEILKEKNEAHITEKNEAHITKTGNLVTNVVTMMNKLLMGNSETSKEDKTLSKKVTEVLEMVNEKPGIAEDYAHALQLNKAMENHVVLNYPKISHPTIRAILNEYVDFSNKKPDTEQEQETKEEQKEKLDQVTNMKNFFDSLTNNGSDNSKSEDNKNLVEGVDPELLANGFLDNINNWNNLE
jgi:hypothetical protein